MTQLALAAAEKKDVKTIRKYTKLSQGNPQGLRPYLTPRETTISKTQRAKRVDYASKNKDTDFFKSNWTFVDTTPISQDGTPNRRNKPQWLSPNNKSKLKKAPKHKHSSKFQATLGLNRYGISKIHIHANRRRLKSGARKGAFTFDHLGVGKHEIAKAVRTVVIPFMKETSSKIVVMDTTRNNHNDIVYEVFKDAGIKVYPSAGYNSGKKTWLST